jgi:hypothetical protein
MPEGYPWGMPLNFNARFRPDVSEVPVPTTQLTIHVSQTGIMFPQGTVPASITFSALVVHTIPQDKEPIYYTKNVGASDRMDDFREKFDEMQREINVLRGKDITPQLKYLEYLVKTCINGSEYK